VAGVEDERRPLSVVGRKKCPTAFEGGEVVVAISFFPHKIEAHFYGMQERNKADIGPFALSCFSIISFAHIHTYKITLLRAK